MIRRWSRAYLRRRAALRNGRKRLAQRLSWGDYTSPIQGILFARAHKGTHMFHH